MLITQHGHFVLVSQVWEGTVAIILSSVLHEGMCTFAAWTNSEGMFTISEEDSVV